MSRHHLLRLNENPKIKADHKLSPTAFPNHPSHLLQIVFHSIVQNGFNPGLDSSHRFLPSFASIDQDCRILAKFRPQQAPGAMPGPLCLTLKLDSLKRYLPCPGSFFSNKLGWFCHLFLVLSHQIHAPMFLSNWLLQD